MYILAPYRISGRNIWSSASYRSGVKSELTIAHHTQSSSPTHSPTNFTNAVLHVTTCQFSHILYIHVALAIYLR